MDLQFTDTKMTAPASTELFRSYWMAGYEGADHINRAGNPLSMNHSTHHAERAYDDYRLLEQFGIRTVRESIGWRLTETQGRFDFSSIESRIDAARRTGLQIVWTLCHYGWPAGIDLESQEFVERFACFCRAAARYLAPLFDGNTVYSPMNEISYMTWGLCKNLLSNGDRRDYVDATEVKRQLVRATIAGCDAIWESDPHARILHCDPVIHVVASDNRPDLNDAAASCAQSQFESWDMLCGRVAPELGGAPRYLDLIGVNYYHSNQWEFDTNERLWWHLGNARRVSLHRLLHEVQQRYRRPVLLSETSHVGSGRGAWIKELARETVSARNNGIALHGICLYPIIDRPDWDDVDHWHRSGLWDVDIDGEEKFQRVLSEPYAYALHQAQRITGLQCPINTPIRRQGDRMPAIIVFSHLRWDFVYQRPQHLLSHLAEYYQVIFIEEPVWHEGESFFKISSPAPNVHVYQPHTQIGMAGFHDDQLPQLRKLMRQLIVDHADHIAWFYTPMALPLLQDLQPRLVVYDCMDELAAFKNAPKQLLQRESAVLKRADIVFAGGPSLYRARSGRHPNVHCFPSSVDVVHFTQALDRSNSHPHHRSIPGPRLGYYGVIDERFDAQLIAQVADAHPQWQIVLVGPITKIDPASLPQRANIHYLGQQPYQSLPHFLAGWDVCLLPFALNESTRFVSPTKTLEYLAAELPVVSTPITDVVDLYGEVVCIAADATSFIAACEEALLAPPAAQADKVAAMRRIVASSSWESTARKMHALLEAAPVKEIKGGHETAESADLNENVNALRKAATMPHVKCVIVGAGPTGLSAAYHLDGDTLVLDKNAGVGGWCRSIEDKGFTFDHAGHIMFSNDPYVLKLYQTLLGDNLHWQNREAWVYSKQVYTRYPFQGALYGLPPEVIKECIIGAVEARYGSLKKPDVKCDAANGREEQGDGKELDSMAAPAQISDCCADGSVTLPPSRLSSAPFVSLENRQPANFEEFIYQTWGAGIAKHFAIPYNRKLWTVPLTEMETSWLGGRVPLPDMEEIIEGALQPTAKPMGPNARFGYPLRGGFQALMSGFLPHIKGTIELNADVVRVSPREHLVALADGRRFQYDHLISTMPLPELIKRIGDAAPDEVRQAARALRHVSVRCVNLGIAREDITDKHWIYYPEETIFHRIFVQGNASPECNAPGGFGLTCEITYSPTKPLPYSGQRLIERCMADLIEVGFLKADDRLLTANQVDMPYAYVLYDHARARNVAIVKAWLAEYDIALAGRYSEWEYYNSDHAFIAGKKAAEAIKWEQPKKSAL